MVRVVSVPYSMITDGTPLLRLRQQAGSLGCVYAVILRRFSLRHHRLERRVAKELVAVAGHERDAVAVQHVHRVGDLLQRLVDVRHRHQREHAEAARMRIGELARVLVRCARHRGGFGRGQEAHGGQRRRGDRRGDAGLVHVFQRTLRRPVVDRRRVELALLQRGDPGGRRDMVVNVDALGGARAGGRAAGRGQCAHRRGGAEEAAAREARSGRFGMAGAAVRGVFAQVDPLWWMASIRFLVCAVVVNAVRPDGGGEAYYRASAARSVTSRESIAYAQSHCIIVLP